MVDKRSLRSSKKDSQDAHAEEDKPKPTRTRSSRSRKASKKTEETSDELDTSSAPPAVNQSEDVVMETESIAAAEKVNEDDDVEMKNVDGKEAPDEANKSESESAQEDPVASPLTSEPPFASQSNL
jgi:flagella basal body P-ring formation protein FlgA